MRARNLVTLVALAALLCVFFSADSVTAARKAVSLDGQVCALDFSKAVPGQLNYQGYLVDAADSSAVTATLEMTFRLFDAESGGTEQWSETHVAVAVSNGLFQVLLGSVTPFPDGLFDGSSLWLQTEVGPEILAPRKSLVSVAYSHRTNSAEMLLGNTLMDLDDRWVNEDQANSVSSAMITDGAIVDDDVSATADIDPAKIAGTAWTADNDGAGSGLDADLLDGQEAADFLSTANDYGRSGVATDLYEGATKLSDKYVGQDDLDHLDAADGDPANAVYVDNDGDVGIGTPSPAEKLDVNGTAQMTGFKMTTGATNGYVLTSDASGVGTWQAAAGGADGDWTISGNDMYSAVSGNVGIGTTNPQEKLDTPGTVRIGNPAATFSAEVGLGIIAEDATFSSVPLLVINPSIEPILYARGDGKVGIGTASPGAKFEVNYDNSSSTTPAIVIDNPHDPGGQDVLDFRFSGTTYARIRQAKGGDLFFGTEVNNGLNLQTNGTNRLKVTADGKVGIGTTAPDYTLDVAGDAGFNQYLYHNGDENTYLKFTSDQIDLYAGDVWLLSAEETLQDEVIINDGSADVDFRVESDDDAYAFIVRGSDGRVGMGTSSPAEQLEVAGEVLVSSAIDATALEVLSTAYVDGSRMVNFETDQDVSANRDMLQIKVGAGSADGFQFIECERGSDVEFKVEGDGDVFADGSYTGPADFSEMIAVSAGASSVEMGDVMVIDPDNPRAIMRASEQRSTLVAGIYSTRPGFIGSERDWDKSTGRAGEELGTYTLEDMAAEFNEVPLAVVGIVPCKVSAENGQIRPGDLLVTSSTPGHAMRDDNPKVGTVLGKALESLASGTGVIKVLVTLH